MRQRSLDVDDRHVVRPIVGHDDLSPIRRPGKSEWSGLAIGIVGSDLHPGHLGDGEPILARSTSAIEIVFPSTSCLQGAIGFGALTALIEAGTRLGSALEKRCASPQGMEGLSIYYPRTSKAPLLDVAIDR